MKKRPFKLPVTFLKQLGEFTAGYYLIVINSDGDFETYTQSDCQVNELALINYLDMQGDILQEVIRNRAIEEAMGGKSDEDDTPEEDAI